MTGATGQRAWPGALEWGGDWFAETQRELAHLGFVLRDGSVAGATPGPRLLVALRDRPTMEHFDPELVTYWEARDGKGPRGDAGPVRAVTPRRARGPGVRSGSRTGSP